MKDITHEQPIIGSNLFTDFNDPIWSIINIQNCINKSLADKHITYDEWHRLMSYCADILKRITEEEKQ